MSYRGNEFKINDFSGGLVVTRPVTELELNESPDLDNIVVFPKGQGFRSRNGDEEFNASAMSAGAAVTGLGYYKKDDQTDFLVAVAGSNIYKSDGLDGTMDDITGAVTVTSGNNYHWSLLTFNDKLLGFGGNPYSPNSPFYYDGTGNAAALGGSAPAAYHAFQTNNRVFAIRTAADPSRVYWSILGNEADWTGVGSGYADVWTSDNDSLTAEAVLNSNTTLLFKENSVHQMQTGNIVDSSFPIFPLFKNVGCVGKGACVVVDGLVYFITPKGDMKITDGSSIVDLKENPNLADIDPLWASTNLSRLPFIQGAYYSGDDYEHIIWCVSYGESQNTNNVSFIWDLRNKCWLLNSSGYACNKLAKNTLGNLYGGHYDGKIYKKDIAGKYTDDSNSGDVVYGYRVSGWLNSGKYENIKQIRQANIAFTTQTGGLIRFSYGYDFQGLNKLETLDQTGAVSLWDTALWDSDNWSSTGFNLKNRRTVGRGNFFQFKIETPTDDFPLKIHAITLSGKEYGQKVISAN
jgi:hypothetical protein